MKKTTDPICRVIGCYGQSDQMLNLKVAQIFPIVAPKVTTVFVYHEKVLLFTLAQNSPCILGTFERNLVTKNFQK